MQQQMEDLMREVFDVIMKLYTESLNSNDNEPYHVTDNLPNLTSSQIIRLRLKAPGLIQMPADETAVAMVTNSVGRRSCEVETDQAPAKRIKISSTGTLAPTPPGTAAVVVDHMTADHMTADHMMPGKSRAQSPPDRQDARDLTPIEEYRLRPQFRKCVLCNVMFGTNDQLAAHISTAHKDTQTWNCIAHTTCPMVFMDIRSLRSHVFEIHIEECPVCKCRFEEHSLAKHIICTHAVLTTCPICSNQYADQHTLMVHVKTQHDVPAYRLRTESTLSVKSEPATSP